MAVEIDIDHVARLARLDLTDEERARLRSQLGAILEHAAKLGEVATEDVPPTARAIPLSNVYRPDEPGVPIGSIPREDALANAPAREDDRFRVPRVAEVE
jgi:aspartyl-tRNA(Asn)/glutamyl-tRNA(Gln) amidotransferase subunit C